MSKNIIRVAAVFGMLAVIAGALGAHALKEDLSITELEDWHTAVEYQFYHVFALLFLSTTHSRSGNTYKKSAFYLFTFGIIFFSGSLYLLACRDLLGLNWVNVVGPITPVGGVMLVFGWLMVLLAAPGSNKVKDA
jgi:uncharacterized membrane protein YgdD (TMEM256/DUF423 family)